MNVTRTELAKLLKLSPRRIEQLANSGIVHRADRGKYHLVESVHGYIDYLRDQIDSAGSPAADRLRLARAQEIEMRIARESRKLVYLDEYLEHCDLTCGKFISCLSGLPARITRDRKERVRIEGIIDQERQRLADEFAELRDAAQEGRDPDPYTEDD